VPSSKGLNGTPPPLAEPIDRFKCYRVRRAAFRMRNIAVATQFGTSLVDIIRPLHLCVPANKNGEGLADPTDHLMCYSVRAARPTSPTPSPRSTSSAPTRTSTCSACVSFVYRRAWTRPGDGDGNLTFVALSRDVRGGLEPPLRTFRDFLAPSARVDAATLPADAATVAG
jgi:hypothetical protein